MSVLNTLYLLCSNRLYDEQLGDVCVLYGYSPLEVMQFKVHWYWMLIKRIRRTNAERIINQATAVLMLFDEDTRKTVHEQLRPIQYKVESEKRSDYRTENEELMSFLRSEIDGRRKR